MRRRICVAVLALLAWAAWPATGFADGGWGSDPPTTSPQQPPLLGGGSPISP
jgi:hypothetical protein